MTADDIRRGQEVIGHLMTVNTGMGRVVQRMHEYEAEHGHLPADGLRTLANLLYEVAAELGDYADQLDRPPIESVLRPRPALPPSAQKG